MKKLLLLCTMAVLLSSANTIAQVAEEVIITRETFGTQSWDINNAMVPRAWYPEGFARVSDSATHFKASHITTFTSLNGVIRGGLNDNSIRINSYDDPGLTATRGENYREPSGIHHVHMGIRDGNAWMGSWDTTFFQGINIRGYEVSAIELGFARARTQGADVLRWADVHYRVDGGEWVLIDTTLFNPTGGLARSVWHYIQAPVGLVEHATHQTLDIRVSAIRANEQFYIDDITVMGFATSFIPVTALTVTSPAETVAAGGTMQMATTVAPADATNQAVRWSVDAPAVATISATGVLTGVAEGTVIVTARTSSAPTVTATKTITVGVATTVPVTGITVTSPAETITTAGGTLQMAATVAPANATNPAVTWSVDAAAVATISVDGVLTAVANGTVVVTATSVSDPAVTGTKTITVNITVGVPSVDNVFALYPVPVESQLFITSSVSIERVEVLGIDGRVLISKLLNGGNSVDLSALRAGIYIVRVTKVNGEVVTRSITKN